MFGGRLDWAAWSEELAVGIPAIDDDHRGILALIGELKDLADGPETEALERRVLARVRDYSNRHFAREEAMLAKAGYPHLDVHRALHDGFRAYVAEIEAPGAELPHPLVLLSWLVNWWVGHIATDDKRYRDHVLARSPGEC